VEIPEWMILKMDDGYRKGGKGSYLSQELLKVTDAKTIKAVESEIEVLQDKICVEKDPSKLLEYTEDLKQYEDYLNDAQRSPGKIRSFRSNNDENCRTAVQKSIAKAINKIHQEIPNIKKYINKETIVTGYKCFYKQDHNNPVKWALRAPNS
jgi:hypothetical protein